MTIANEPVPDRRDEPFYGCRICLDPNNHSNHPHSEALGCSCTREKRDERCPAVLFNAKEIIAEAWREDRDPLTALVYQSVGAASASWEHLEAAGVFDDRSATHVAEQLLAGIQLLTERRVDEQR